MIIIGPSNNVTISGFDIDAGLIRSWREDTQKYEISMKKLVIILNDIKDITIVNLLLDSISFRDIDDKSYNLFFLLHNLSSHFSPSARGRFQTSYTRTEYNPYNTESRKAMETKLVRQWNKKTLHHLKLVELISAKLIQLSNQFPINE